MGARGWVDWWAPVWRRGAVGLGGGEREESPWPWAALPCHPPTRHPIHPLNSRLTHHHAPTYHSHPPTHPPMQVDHAVEQLVSSRFNSYMRRKGHLGAIVVDRRVGGGGWVGGGWVGGFIGGGGNRLRGGAGAGGWGGGCEVGALVPPPPPPPPPLPAADVRRPRPCRCGCRLGGGARPTRRRCKTSSSCLAGSAPTAPWLLCWRWGGRRTCRSGVRRVGVCVAEGGAWWC